MLVFYFICQCSQFSRCVDEMEAILQLFVINRGQNLSGKSMNVEECLSFCKIKEMFLDT